ncbi:MAG: histidine phosphotransferase family protein [Pseudomonadota bacterium]
MTSDMGYASLLATRLCHDLASPIGAISNTADLMKEFGDQQSMEDVDMVARTAARASQMLQFYRLVFGRSMADDPGIDIARFLDLCRSQEVPKRIGLTFGGLDSGALPRPMAQVAGLMLMVGRSVLGLRGELRLMLPASAADLPQVAAKGEKVALPEGLHKVLTEDGAEMTDPAKLEFALLRLALRAVSAQLSVTQGPQHISLSATYI